MYHYFFKYSPNAETVHFVGIEIPLNNWPPWDQWGNVEKKTTV